MGYHSIPSRLEDSTQLDVSRKKKIKAEPFDEQRGRCGIPRWFWSELYMVFDLAWTLALNNIIYSLVPPLSLMFSGHLGTDELGGVALANTFLLIMGTLMTGGMTVACDTVFAQSFGSANKKECGIYLQKSFMLITMMVSVSSFLHINSETILYEMGQNPIIARITGDYLLITLPALIFHALFSVLVKYLRCQGIVVPLLITASVGLVVNLITQYLLVIYYEIGPSGSAWAFLCTHFSMLICLSMYTLCSGVYKPTWGGWTVMAFQDWGMISSLMLFGWLMIQLQWWGFEIGTLMSGLLGDKVLAAQSILFQVEAFSFQVPAGIGNATNIRVGQQLGASSASGARRSIKAGFALIFLMSTVEVSLILACMDVFPYLFTNDQGVAELTSSIIPLMAVYNVFDSVCAGSSGILRGCGKQSHASAIVFIGMYLVGLPVGLSLMFLTDLGIAGFWMGLTCALMIESVLYVWAIVRTDWELEARKAQVRAKVVKSDSLEEDELDLMSDDDLMESQSLLHKEDHASASRVSLAQRTKYCGEYTSSQPDITIVQHHPAMLPWPSVVFRRSLVVLVCAMIIGTGVVLRLEFKPDWVCLSSWQFDSSWAFVDGNRTAVNIWNNGTMPVC